MSELMVALSVLAIGAVLFVVGLPDKAGNSPRFLRFSSAVVIYPPIVPAFLAVGFAMLIFSIMSK